MKNEELWFLLIFSISSIQNVSLLRQVMERFWAIRMKTTLVLEYKCNQEKKKKKKTSSATQRLVMQIILMY